MIKTPRNWCMPVRPMCSVDSILNFDMVDCVSINVMMFVYVWFAVFRSSKETFSNLKYRRHFQTSRTDPDSEPFDQFSNTVTPSFLTISGTSWREGKEVREKWKHGGVCYVSVCVRKILVLYNDTVVWFCALWCNYNRILISMDRTTRWTLNLMNHWGVCFI